MCHVLTVFTFTDSVCPPFVKNRHVMLNMFWQAKYAYRSIAEFIKHVTTHSAEHLDANPFPEFHIPPEEIADSSSEEGVERSKPRHDPQSSKFASFFKRSRGTGTAPAPISSQVEKTDVLIYKANERAAKEEHQVGVTETMVEAEKTDSSSSSKVRS